MALSPILAEKIGAENIYIAIDGSFAHPVVFSGGDNLTNAGFGVGAEAGIDFNGWLFGVSYGFLRYLGGGESLMETFTHNIVSLSASKIFTKSQWRFLPEWLATRLKLSAGQDFALAEYKTAYDEIIKKEDSGFLYSAGLFFEFTKVPFVTPFLGADFNFIHDKGGVYFMPLVSLGVRTRVGNFKTRRKEVSIIDPALFSENSDVSEKDVFVVKEGDRYRINVPGIIFDSYASTFENLSEEQKKKNERIIEIVYEEIKKMSEYKVIVEGHANNVTGTKEEEEKDLVPLSEERAKTVMQILIEKGIDKKRLKAVGMGSKKPLGKGDDAWLNRRVEFVLEK